MRYIIYLTYDESPVAAFTRPKNFCVDTWAALHRSRLDTMGVTRIDLEKVPDDFRLPWETP